MEGLANKLNAILDSITDPVIVVDENAVIRYANVNSKKVFGWTREELMGLRLEDVIQGEAHMKRLKSNGFQNSNMQAMEAGTNHFVIRKDGKKIQAKISISTIDLEGGAWTSISIREFTAENNQDQHKNHLASIIEFSSDAIISKSLDGIVTTWNRGAEEILGYQAAEIIGKHISILFPPELKDEEEVLMGKIKASEPIKQHDTVRVKKDGTKIKVSITLSPIKNDEGKIVGVSKVLRDVTAKQELMQEAMLLRTIINNIPINIYAKNLKSEKILANRTEWEYVYAKSEHEVLGKSDLELYPSESAMISFAEDKRIFSGESMLNVETFNTRLNGQQTWFLTSKVPFRNPDGQIAGLIGIGIDITDRKKAEEKANKASSRLNIATSSSKIGIWEYDVKHNEMEWDNITLELYGLDSQNFTATFQDWQNAIHPEDKEHINREIDRALNENKELECEFRIVWPDQSIHIIKLNAITRLDQSGKVISLIGTNRDITEQKIGEERLRNYSILEAKSKEMEQFTYIASHDLREPLLTIKNYINILMEDFALEFNEDFKRYTNSISTAANRMEALISGLLDYSRLSKPKQLQETDCHEIVQATILDLASLVTSNKANIIVGQLPVLNVYPIELGLLFQNLIVNAIKFKKKDVLPEIHITAKPVTNGWQFEVRDNGIGINKGDERKIFEIFQRLHNREDYPCTGIGLAHCRKIVELHNGHIWVVSNLGVGSSFYFTILTY